MPAWRRALPGAGLFLLISVVVYWRALHGGFIWDDDAHAGNPDVKNPSGFFRLWFDPDVLRRYGQYYPLTRSLFWLQNQLWEGSTFGFHLVNVLLHGANAIVAWLILKRLNVRGAWLAAAIFVVHPVHVESVAWIAEMKNMLSGVFYLAATLAYIEFALPEEAQGGAEADPAVRKRRRRAYTWALVLFVCALLSKTVTATLPAAMLLIIWWKRGALSWKRDVIPALPFFAIGTVLGLVTAWLEKTVIGAKGSDFALTFIERVLVAGRAAWFYLGKLLWPADLTFIYPRWDVSAKSAWQFVFPAAAALLVLYLWSAARRSKSAPWRGALVAVLFFGGTLFPALGFLDVFPFLFSFVADHFQYLASLGIIALGAALLVTGLKQLGLWETTGGNLLCAALLGVLGVLTWKQTGVYHDSETLWLDTLRKNPKAWIAHTNLGVDLQERGRMDEAIARYHQALALKPDNAYTLNNIGTALARQGKLEEGIEYYRRAQKSMPNNAETLNNLGNALYALGRVDEAMKLYTEVVTIDPGFVDTQLVVASALVAKGDLQAAIGHYEALLDVRPDVAQAHFELANALGTTGKVEEALEHYREALRIRPDYPEALNNMGVFLGGMGRVDEAIESYRRATEMHGDYVDALINLGGALAHKGQVDEALTYYRRAAKAAPSDPKALANLGTALATFGKLDEATTVFRDLLRIQPADANVRASLGQLLVMQGKADEAIKLYEEGLRTDSTSLPLRLAMADALIQTGQVEQASAQYREVLKANPQSAEARLGLGLALIRSGNNEEAVTQFNEVIRLDPANEGAQVSLVQALRAQGKVAEAIGHAQQVLRSSPNSIPMINDLAWVLATHADEKVRNPRESLMLSKRALELTQARDPQVLDTLGAGFAAIGDFAQAVTAATKAIELANAAGRKEIVPEIQSRLTLYQAQKPFIDAPTEAGAAPPPK